jgi:oligogalacturonide lyase
MGAGPNGIARMNIRTGEVRHVVSVPFQIGHIQANLWNPGEIVFCWETGGKSPQRTWTVLADGSGLRPLYPEASYEWVTHEAVISKDEVAMAIMGHRPIPARAGRRRRRPPASAAPIRARTTAGASTGTREKPSGLAIVNLRTREMRSPARRRRAAACGMCMARRTAAGRLAMISAAACLPDRPPHRAR